MVTLAFHSRSSGKEVFEATDRRMALEVCGSSLTVLLWNNKLQQPDSVEVFTGIAHLEDQWDAMVVQSELLNICNLETIVIYNNRRFLPIPAVFFNPDSSKEQLAVMFGEAPFQHHGADVVPYKDMVISWEAPRGMYECITGHFQVIRSISLGSALVQVGSHQLPNEASGWVVINGVQVFIGLWRSGQLLLLKSFIYKEPSDLAYQLVLSCQQWGIEKDEIRWNVAGMVEKDSPLWQSSHRFFSHFDPAEGAPTGEGNFPAHYFAHLVQYLKIISAN